MRLGLNGAKVREVEAREMERDLYIFRRLPPKKRLCYVDVVIYLFGIVKTDLPFGVLENVKSLFGAHTVLRKIASKVRRQGKEGLECRLKRSR